MECCSGTELRPDQGHYINFQYLEKSHGNYVQAAHNAGLTVITVSEGNVFDDERNIRVSEGHVGVKVWVHNQEDAAKYWAAFDKIEKNQEDV